VAEEKLLGDVWTGVSFTVELSAVPGDAAVGLSATGGISVIDLSMVPVSVGLLGTSVGWLVELDFSASAPALDGVGGFAVIAGSADVVAEFVATAAALEPAVAVEPAAD
jgi:hypothetical protein